MRAHHPQVQSLLMDEETLLRHRDLWSHDDSKPGSQLARLSIDEQRLYGRLGQGAFGPAIRLEQERIGWAWAMDRVRATVGGVP